MMYFPVEDFRNLQLLLDRIDVMRDAHPAGPTRDEFACGYTLFDVYEAADRLTHLKTGVPLSGTAGASGPSAIPREDEEPAFPHMMAKGHRDYAAGMSLRDYFAAQAMQGWCGTPGSMGINMQTIVDAAYAIADAMLEARKP